MSLFTRAAAAALALGLASAPALADDSEFRVGGVVSLSGSFGVLGDAMRKGAELAVEMRGGKVLGVPVVFLWEDDETKPQVAVQKATRLQAEGVHMLFGAVSSGSTMAIMELAARRRLPLIVTTSASDEITGTAGNDYTFRTANLVEMENRMMAEFVAGQGVKKVYGVVADYTVGRQMWDSLSAMLDERGVEIVGADLFPLGNKDFSLIVDSVAQSDAEAVAMITAGADTITFLKQAELVRLKDEKMIFGTMIMDEVLGNAVGEGSYGVHSTLRYHFSEANPANEAFVAAYRAKYNEWPSQIAGEAFDGMSWFLSVVDATGSWKSEDWVAAFKGSVYTESVEGTKVMRSCDNQAEQVGLFGRAKPGEAPYPPVTMEVIATFEAAQLFKPCP